MANGTNINVTEVTQKTRTIVKSLMHSQNKMLSDYNNMKSQFVESEGEFKKMLLKQMSEEQRSLDSTIKLLIRVVKFIEESTISYQETDKKIGQMYEQRRK
ncbi:hypothetical protein HB790_10205 [Listeria welshimeri]|uniref:hypothetical protein n=1 Tax=Listeria welshimeri TaxID=1643 RepID=UPI00162645B9|nr:hypothetical protein [Listeria welshimeri]MBC1389029.1 hypothetical protein [Listeria welshimeri]MBC1452511.1 hypothetical protein [Listeria welshimeri]MBF2469342.1 hypothetical protein [Listeria welshimeri]MBF2507817.1 hypothetical protein [Listeria welshimeri]MBF2566549.1 hypothetical protein [Listeria welshimeri]